MRPDLHVLGAGGHAAVVCDAAHLMAKWDTITVYDDATPERLPSNTVFGGNLANAVNQSNGLHLIVAIGSADVRLALGNQLTERGAQLVTVVHPAAVLAGDVALGAGSVVCAGAILNAGSVTGEGVIINTGAIADHHCRLGAGVHLCPGVTLAGRVEVGERSWIGVGACVRDGVVIGTNTVVGAGAVVVSDLPSNSLAVGCPAKPQTRNGDT